MERFLTLNNLHEHGGGGRQRLLRAEWFSLRAPVRARLFLFLTFVQKGPGGPPSFLYNRHRDTFPVIKRPGNDTEFPPSTLPLAPNKIMNRTITFRCDIPVVFYRLNTKYITISQNTTKMIVLCCTICFTTTCFGPFLQAIFRLCTLGLESHVSYIQIYYIDDEISVIIILHVTPIYTEHQATYPYYLTHILLFYPHRLEHIYRGNLNTPAPQQIPQGLCSIKKATQDYSYRAIRYKNCSIPANPHPNQCPSIIIYLHTRHNKTKVV